MPDAGRTREAACKEGVHLCAREQRQGSRDNRHSLRNGVTASCALSPECRLDSLRRPRLVTRDLMPASGHQDHTPSPSASNALVSRTDTSIAARFPRS